MVTAPPKPTPRPKQARLIQPPRYRTWQEWEVLGVKIELWSREKAPYGLLREERESCINFMGTDTYAEILAARPDWMRRIEGLGIIPTRIEAYEKGDGERRWYQIPVSLIRRPYSGDKGGKHHAWQKWAEMGIPVQHSADSFPRAEQETSIAFTDAETMMEIGTCNKSWHRRLEGEGSRAWTIDASRDGHGEYRSYILPKSWVKLPGKRGRR